MKNIEKEEELEFLEMVKEKLKKQYGFNQEEITDRMESSGFNELFQKDKNYFYHYSVIYTAEFIYTSKYDKQ